MAGNGRSASGYCASWISFSKYGRLSAGFAFRSRAEQTVPEADFVQLWDFGRAYEPTWIVYRSGRWKDCDNMKNHRGQALVEFVVVLPILIMLLFATIDFGLIIYNKSKLESKLKENSIWSCRERRFDSCSIYSCSSVYFIWITWILFILK